MTASPVEFPGVREALRAAFATDAPDGWKPLSGGLSGARLWRIRVGGIAYLLRVETGRDALRDPRRAYRCQALAAQACLAPRVRYADPDDGVMITDFVEARSLTLDYAGTRADLVVELAQAARALHALEAFPVLTDYLDALDGLVDRAARGGAVAFEALARPLEAWARLRAVCASLAPQPVASHNDLNPRNLLYDGRRVWLIDWEAAFRADRYVDLAALANVFAPDPEREALLLATYFGREARADERARLYLFRQVSHVISRRGVPRRRQRRGEGRAPGRARAGCAPPRPGPGRAVAGDAAGTAGLRSGAAADGHRPYRERGLRPGGADGAVRPIAAAWGPRGRRRAAGRGPRDRGPTG